MDADKSLRLFVENKESIMKMKGLTSLVLTGILVVASCQANDKKLSIALSLIEDSLDEGGKIVVAVTMRNDSNTRIHLLPRLYFGVIPINHSGSMTGWWRKDANRIRLNPGDKYEENITLNDLEWRDFRSMYLSSLPPPKRFTEVITKGEYRISCSYNDYEGKEKDEGPTVYRSNTINIKVESDVGGKIAKCLSVLRNQNAPREEVSEAFHMLRIWRTKEAIDQISTRLLEDKEDEIRLLAAHALSLIHEPEAIPCLLQALKDTNRRVRESCRATLRSLTGAEFFSGPLGTNYEKWNKWWEETGKRQLSMPWGEPENGLSFKIATRKEVYTVGEKVWINCMFKNVGGKKIRIPLIHDMIEPINVETLYFDFVVKEKSRGALTTLKPEAQWEEGLGSHYGANYSHMRVVQLLLNKWKVKTKEGFISLSELPGVYTIYAIYKPKTNNPKVWTGTLTSSTITLTIVEQ